MIHFFEGTNLNKKHECSLSLINYGEKKHIFKDCRSNYLLLQHKGKNG